ncbi:MAG TPA: S8 family serine peptidase [Candidatus Limnocylindria bacterium]|nr:S8 family serine peptidase [Candidatus Limnocylindria bacterium]
MSRAVACLLAVIVLLASAALPVAARAPEGDAVAPDDARIIPGEVIVQFREGRADEVTRVHGLTVEGQLGADKAAAPALVSTRGRGVNEVIAELLADPSVLRAEPNYVVRLAEEQTVAAVLVNDPKTGDQYSLDRMRVRDAWSRTTGGHNVVAVLDTGIQLNHPDLVGRTVRGYDFVHDDTNPSDDNGHGTWVSGIIAAHANDAYGIAGITWTDKIMPIKIMDREGTGSTADLLAGIQWATANGADVINMSVGGFPYSQIMQDAVNAAWNKGVVLVGAAGNNRRRESYYPASFEHVVSVSATQPEDEFSNWSSYGPKVDVSAPGSSVLTTNCYVCTYADHDSWGTHTFISGTSFATPNVAGVVALIRAVYPNDSAQQIVNRLVDTTDDLGYAGWDERYGSGRVNAQRAVTGSAPGVGASAGDGHEPNNTVGTATPMSLGGTVRPSIHPASDVDVYSLSLPRAGRLEVRVTGIVDTRAYPWNKSGLPIDPIVEILSGSGSVLKRVDAQWEGGTELATWTVAGPTRVLVRVTNWYPNGNRGAYQLSTKFVDEVPPRAVGLVPAPNSTMAPTRKPVTFTFSEPVTGVDATSVTLRTNSGKQVPATVTYASSTRKVTVTPTVPMPSGMKMTLLLSDAIRDAANLTPLYSGYKFTTMPGTTFVPSRRVSFAAGTHVGHRFAQDGTVLGLRSGRLAHGSSASGAQRALLPNLPGAWIYVENGAWAGTWIAESARAWVPGSFDEQTLPAGTRIIVRNGTHVGRAYDSDGGLLSSRTVTLGRSSGAPVDAVAVINGVRQYHVTAGLFAGMWLRESTKAYRDGFIDRMNLSPTRRIQIGAGAHVGLRLDATGTQTGSVSARLDRTSGANISAWAVVDGRARVLVTNGIWAGTWLPAEDVLAYSH